MVRTGGWFMNGKHQLKKKSIHSITYHYENYWVLPHEWTNKIEVWLPWREQCREFDTKKRGTTTQDVSDFSPIRPSSRLLFGSSSKAPLGNPYHGLPGDPYPATFPAVAVDQLAEVGLNHGEVTGSALDDWWAHEMSRRPVAAVATSCANRHLIWSWIGHDGYLSSRQIATISRRGILRHGNLFVAGWPSIKTAFLRTM